MKKMKREDVKKIEVKTLYLEPKQPNSLQKKMLEMAGQDLDQFMKVQDEQDNCSSFFFIPLRWGAWGGGRSRARIYKNNLSSFTLFLTLKLFPNPRGVNKDSAGRGEILNLYIKLLVLVGFDLHFPLISGIHKLHQIKASFPTFQLLPCFISFIIVIHFTKICKKN